MLNDSAKAKLISALQPLYADADFANVKSDFFVTVVSDPVVTVPDTEQVDIIKP